MLGIVPDLVVEVLSPSTARRDRTEKSAIYARNGDDEYWLVDDRKEEVLLFRRQESVLRLAVELSSGPLRSGVLPALDLPIESLFKRPD